MCEKPQSFLVHLGVVLCRHEAWRCGDRQQRWNWRRLLDARLDDWRLRPAAPQPGQVENAAREKTDRDCEQAELKSAARGGCRRAVGRRDRRLGRALFHLHQACFARTEHLVPGVAVLKSARRLLLGFGSADGWCGRQGRWIRRIDRFCGQRFGEAHLAHQRRRGRRRSRRGFSAHGRRSS